MLPRYENKLNDIRTQLSALVASITLANKETLAAFESDTDALYEDAKQHLKTVQADANLIDGQVIKTLALYGPEADELRMLVAFLKLTNELDRVGENMKKYNARLQVLCAGECDIKPMAQSISQLQKTTINALNYIHDYLDKLQMLRNCFEKYRLRSLKMMIFFQLLKRLLNVIVNLMSFQLTM
jgi:phosphate transport system protein